MEDDNKSYKLCRSYRPGRGSWNMRATRRKLTRSSEKGGSLVVECEHADHKVRFVIPLGPGSEFARTVLPFLTFDDKGSCSFDVSPRNVFTWRQKIKFDGRPFIQEAEKEE